jgi:hypothetical protein
VLSPGVTLLTDPEQVIVQAAAPTRVEVVEAPAAAEAAPEGEAPAAEGEEAAGEDGRQPSN